MSRSDRRAVQAPADAPAWPRIPDALVVIVVALVLAALYVRQVPETIERTRAVEWFAQSAPLRAALHEHYALTGDWNLPAGDAPTASAAHEAKTVCESRDGRIACRFADPARPATLVLSPVATAGSVNWACDRRGENSAWRWFHVCAGGYPFEQPAGPAEER